MVISQQVQKTVDKHEGEIFVVFGDILWVEIDLAQGFLLDVRSRKASWRWEGQDIFVHKI